MNDPEFISSYFDLGRINTKWIAYWHDSEVRTSYDYFTCMEHIIDLVLRNGYNYAPPIF